VTSAHRQHAFLELEDFVNVKRGEILEEIKEIEGSELPEIQKQRNTINKEKYEDTIEAIFQQEDEICSAVREFGSKLRKTVTDHMLKNEEKGNKIVFTEHMLLKSIQEAKDLVQSENSKAILEFNGIKLTQNPVQPLDDCLPQLDVNSLQEEDIASLFGQLVFKSCAKDKV
jgi:hypothetical protein